MFEKQMKIFKKINSSKTWKSHQVLCKCKKNKGAIMKISGIGVNQRLLDTV